MANPKVSKKDADFSKESPSAIGNIADRMGGWIDREWAHCKLADPSLGLHMVFLTAAALGAQTINDILAAQRVIDTINSCRAENDRLSGLTQHAVEGLHAALQAIGEASSNRMFELMERFRRVGEEAKV